MRIKKQWIVMLCFVIITSMFLIFIGANRNRKMGNKSIQVNKKVILTRNGYTTEMNVEKFIPCVLFAQMDLENDIEAVKAQAIVDRTYIAYMMKNKDTIDARELDLPYYTFEEMVEKWKKEDKIVNQNGIKDFFRKLIGSADNEYIAKKMERLNQIMNETSGKVMKTKGEIALPLFHEMSGGVTRNGVEVLGENYGYYLAIECVDDYNQAEFKKVYDFTVPEFAKKIEESQIVIYDIEKNEKDIAGLTPQEIVQNLQLQLDSSAYAISVNLFATAISGEDFAEALGVASANLTIENVDDHIRITTKGIGHGFGMSMTQACSYAKQGMKCEEILKKFYDVSISE